MNDSTCGSCHIHFVFVSFGGKSVDITKVVAMMDEIVASFLQEQADDDINKTYHDGSIRETECEGTLLANDIKSVRSELSYVQDQLNATGERLQAVIKNIAELDAPSNVNPSTWKLPSS